RQHATYAAAAETLDRAYGCSTDTRACFKHGALSARQASPRALRKNQKRCAPGLELEAIGGKIEHLHRRETHDCPAAVAQSPQHTVALGIVGDGLEAADRD